MDDEGMMSEEAVLCGAEEYLVGLSPLYWSHLPLCIADVSNMKIVGGVNCLVREIQNDSDSNTNTSNTNNKSIQCFPVSRCMLVGTIINAEEKANNSYFYVLDDGTGFIDCLEWGQGENTIYSLPNLMDGFKGSSAGCKGSNQTSQEDEFRVGDIVRVMGRLECVSVSEATTELKLVGQNKTFEVRDCIHELHVNKIEKLTGSAPTSTSTTHNDLDWEANHWVKTIAETEPALNSQQQQGLRHANHVLEWLGPTIRADVEKKRNFPSADDTDGAWKVFGASCQCDLPYKDMLLYCHCQAKAEPLDPNFVYRDKLLSVLLLMERNYHERLVDNETRMQLSASLDFRFQYRTISNHTQLCGVAAQVTSPTSTGQPSMQSGGLIIATFRALREDGILHLLDEKSDTYLLISRKSVLAPYLERSTGRKQKGRGPPTYLQNVPYARLQYLKRCSRQQQT